MLTALNGQAYGQSLGALVLKQACLPTDWINGRHRFNSLSHHLDYCTSEAWTQANLT